MSKVTFLIGVCIVGLSTFLAGQRAWGGAYVSLRVANDVFVLPVKTDQYFTSGIRLEVGNETPGRAPFRVTSTTVRKRYWRLEQNLFTPREIEATDLLANDRPYASFLVASRGTAYADHDLGLELTSEWSAGILGKYSGGGMMQNAFHDMVNFADPLPGWKNEVRPDLVVNYRFRLQLAVAGGRRSRLYTRLQARLGTLFTDLAPALVADWRVVRLSDTKDLRLTTFASARLVGYNATLTGGLLNRDDRFRSTISPERLVGTVGLDGVLRFNALHLSAGLRYLGPEFAGGYDHVWGWFGLRLLPGWNRVTAASRRSTRP